MVVAAEATVGVVAGTTVVVVPVSVLGVEVAGTVVVLTDWVVVVERAVVVAGASAVGVVGACSSAPASTAGSGWLSSPKAVTPTTNPASMTRKMTTSRARRLTMSALP